jgi:hypothetical protein
MSHENSGADMIDLADEYMRTNRRRRHVLGLEDFTEADIAALEQTRAPESSKAFDDELKS